MEEYMLPCTNKMLFGVECTGCGMQRALLLLFQGDFIGAFKMYPAIYTFIPLIILVVLTIFDKKRKYNKLLIILAVINALLMIINYIYKQGLI